MSMQDGTMIEADDRQLVNTVKLAEACRESEDQAVIDFLGQLAEQGAIKAYNNQGEKVSVYSDEDGYFSSSCSPNSR